MKTNEQHKERQGVLANLDAHTAAFAGGGLILSGASFWFNGSFGYEQGGIAMAFAFIGFALAKDGGISYAFGGAGRGRAIAGVAGAIGFVVSCMAALGASSHGRDAAANPLKAQIDAYNTAVKTERDIEAKLKSLGTLSVGQTEAALAKVQVDASIFKRTAACAKVEHSNKRIAAVNRDACSPYLVAKANVDAAREASELTGKLEAAREVIAKGSPASSDAQASTIATILGLDKIDSVQAALNIVLALSIEVIAPLMWAVVTGALHGQKPSPAPAKEAPKAEKRTRIRSVSTDEEVEAIILGDLTRGISRNQEDYAAQFGKSVATISRMVDRLTSKPNARIGARKMGTRRVLYALAS